MKTPMRIDFVFLLLLAVAAFLSSGCTRIETAGDVYAVRGDYIVATVDDSTSSTLAIDASEGGGGVGDFIGRIWQMVITWFGVGGAAK